MVSIHICEQVPEPSAGDGKSPAAAEESCDGKSLAAAKGTSSRKGQACSFLCGKKQLVDPDEVNPSRTCIRWAYDPEDPSVALKKGENCWLCERTWITDIMPHWPGKERKTYQHDLARKFELLQDHLAKREERKAKARSTFEKRVPPLSHSDSAHCSHQVVKFSSISCASHITSTM